MYNDYDEYANSLRLQYGFENVSWGLSLKNGFRVAAVLTQSQIMRYNNMRHLLHNLIVTAELAVVEKKGRVLAQIPKTKVFISKNALMVQGSHEVIEELFCLLFS